MLSWLFLMLAARWMPRAFAIVRVATPSILSLTYIGALVIVAPDWQGGFDSLENVATLFQNEWALLAGWVHYLAFDYLVGCWILSNAIEKRISHLLLVPILAATFMLGPIGYLVFQSFILIKKTRTA